MSEKNNAFCPVPWTQMGSRSDGVLRVCCNMGSSSTTHKGVMLDENGKPFNFGEEGFLNFFNSSLIKSIRKDMVNGIRNPACSHCYQRDDVGLRSKRATSLVKYSKECDLDRAKEITEPDGAVDRLEPVSLDLRFGNLCNLKCIMCSPLSSSKWYSDFYEIWAEKEVMRSPAMTLVEKNGLWDIKEKARFQWYKNPFFWTYIEKNVSNLQYIYIVGGEPLLIQEHLQLLRKCVKEGVAKNITLEYSTNLTIFKSDIVDLWSEFKKVELGVSLEATGLQNDYIRFPSKWSDITENISRIENRLDNLSLYFSSTYQIYNMFCITDLFDYFPDKTTTRLLISPNYLDVKFTPKELKLAAKNHLLNKQEIQKSEHAKNQLASLVRYLELHMDRYDEKRMEVFRKYTIKCDQLRGTSFRKTFPELATLLDV